MTPEKALLIAMDAAFCLAVSRALHRLAFLTGRPVLLVVSLGYYRRSRDEFRAVMGR